MGTIAPLILESSGEWVGIDGNWSAFTLNSGSPGQAFQVLPILTSSEFWLPSKSSCSPFVNTTALCATTRGLDTSNPGFDFGSSTTWRPLGTYYLGGTSALSYLPTADAAYGLDGIELDAFYGVNGVELSYVVTLPSQVIGAYLATEIWAGGFGLNMNNASFPNGAYSSMLTLLRSKQLIPSLSFGFQAGCYSRSSKSRLVLGGYDATALNSDSISWPIDPLPEIQVTGIAAVSAQNRSQNLSISPFAAAVDSLVSAFWLPVSLCDDIASLFSLVYDETTDLYAPANDSVHDALRIDNPELQFTLQGNASGTNEGSLVISIPYKSLDLEWTTIYPNKTVSPYFPMRRTNSSNIVFGRAFLQEAYVIVDWERKNFTLSQARFNGSAPSIVTIQSLNNSESTTPVSSHTALPSPSDSPESSRKQNTSLKIGLIVIAIVAAIVVTWLIYFRWKVIRRRKLIAAKLEDKDVANMAMIKPELHGEHKIGAELMSSSLIELPPESVPGFIMSNAIHELHEDDIQSHMSIQEPFELESNAR